MRVIAGSAKSLHLYSVKGFHVRPTADRIKESLFSSVGRRVVDSRFLDLYSGTGAIGIEALSRGAEFAVFVDNSKECVKIIEKNLDHTKLRDRGRIINGNAISAINDLSGGEIFDIIFLDPPYNKNLIFETLESITENGLISENGLVIAEYGPFEDIVCPKGLEIINEKDYKTTRMVFYTTAA